MSSKDKTFKFSVVMPIYNTINFMREAIDSVINQTIGFEDNIQLILVDDGSSDGSDKVCEEYLAKYPDNVIFHKNEVNSRVSISRNNGIKYIEGEYVAFFDSDDVWPEDAFQKAYDFFKAHDDEIDVISCRMKFFGYKDGYFEGVDGKFQSGEDRVVDLRKEYTALHHGVSSSFIRASIVKQMQFDSTLTSGDDSKFLNTVILRRLKYGLLASVEYGYRKHSVLSVVSKRYSTKKYYTEVDRTLQYFIDLSMEQYGEVVDFIQYLMAYNIGVRLLRKVDMTVINEEELEEYRNKIKYYLSFIRDDIIVQSFTMHRIHKIYALSLKHDDFYERLELNDRCLYYDGLKVYSLKRKDIVTLNIIEVNDDKIKIYGRICLPVKHDENAIYFKSNGKIYPIRYDQHSIQTESLREHIYSKRGFSVEIPLEKNNKIKPVINVAGTEVTLKFKYRTIAPISNELQNGYFYENHYVVSKDKYMIRVEKTEDTKKYEKKYCSELKALGEKKILLLRKLVRFIRWILKKLDKKIWLFGDRIYLGDDNAEFLYDYVKKQHNKHILQYYVITKESSDYERIKRNTRAVIYKTWKYELLYLLADNFVVSTRRFPYGEYHEYFKDIKHNSVYIKHGFDGTDVSKFVNKLKVNDRIYLASAKAERDSYFNGNYGYTDREIKLTGMARDDLLLKLQGKSSKKICIAPTWRMYLALPIDPDTQRRQYDSKFKDSEFYQFYNSLINDERLLKVMREKGYTGVMQPHPNLIEQTKDFVTNDVFTVQDATNKRFLDRYDGIDLVVTDYSSISFEYALIDKSVIYAQFDKEKFYSSQYKEGYFSFENDGFGPVCYDLDSTVDAIIEALENDCKVSEKYEKRRQSFFEFFDGKNCERIYNEILKLD